MNPYIIGVVLLALTLSHGAAYFKGRSDVSDAARIQQLQAENDRLLEDLEREQAARRIDAIQAKLDREDRDMQDIATQELIDALTDRARICFDAGDADRMRDALKSP